MGVQHDGSSDPSRFPLERLRSPTPPYTGGSVLSSPGTSDPDGRPVQLVSRRRWWRPWAGGSPVVAEQPASGTHGSEPDGTPFPLPRRAAAAIGLGVLQQFSGTGITARSVVQRQEQQARRATIALASAAVLLVVVSAFLLFNPTVLHWGFGFAPGQRFQYTRSNQPLVIELTPGTTAPTPTPHPSAHSPAPVATRTPQTGPKPTPVPTAVPTSPAAPTAPAAPTPTSVPTATAAVPTATPISVGTAATVTFSAASQALSVPQTLTACDGCSNSAPGGTLAAATANYGASVWNGSYNAYGQITNGAYELESITLRCWVDKGNGYLGCPSIGQQTLGDTTYGQQCVIGNVFGGPAFTSRTYTCQFTQWGYFSSPNFSGWNWSGCPDPFNPGLADCGFTVAGESVSSYGWTYTTYYMPSGCMGAGGGGSSVQNNATAAANNWLNSNPAGYTNTISQGTSFPSGYYCSDQSSCSGVSPGAPMPNDHQFYSQCQPVAGWHFAFNASQAATVQTQRLQNAVGSGYVLAPGYSVCGSGTVVPGSENGGHSSVTISCNASGAEMYNWTAALQSQLQQQLAGKPISAALSILQGTPGIDTSLTITICTTVNGTQECSPANDTAYLPSNPTQIALSIRGPNGATVQVSSGGGNLAAARGAGTLFAGPHYPAPDQWLPLEWQIPAGVLAGLLVMLAFVWVVRFRRLQSGLGSKESVDP